MKYYKEILIKREGETLKLFVDYKLCKEYDISKLDYELLMSILDMAIRRKVEETINYLEMFEKNWKEVVKKSEEKEEV
jgi:predicted P-loop ATPase